MAPTGDLDLPKYRPDLPCADVLDELCAGAMHTQTLCQRKNLDLSLHDFPLHLSHYFFTLMEGQPDILSRNTISATIDSRNFFNGESFTGKAGLNLNGSSWLG